MKIHIVQHVHFEGPGSIVDWAINKQHHLSYTLLYDIADKFPAIEEIDALVVMGGPMGAYDDRLYPWLTTEKEFIYECIKADKKVLGICLGAQLIATSLNASVDKAKNKEIGWYPVVLTEEGERSWLAGLFKNAPTVFHWHGDTFDIPNGSVNLLNSAANTNQAFLYNKNVLGLQFHLEVKPESVDGLLQNCSNDLSADPYVQSAAQIANGHVHINTMNNIMYGMLDIFFLP